MTLTPIVAPPPFGAPPPHQNGGRPGSALSRGPPRGGRGGGPEPPYADCERRYRDRVGLGANEPLNIDERERRRRGRGGRDVDDRRRAPAFDARLPERPRSPSPARAEDDARRRRRQHRGDSSDDAGSESD